MTRREELEQVIEHCIDLLNMIDGDSDLEDGGDAEHNGDFEQDDCQRSLLCLSGIDGEDFFMGEPCDSNGRYVKQI